MTDVVADVIPTLLGLFGGLLLLILSIVRFFIREQIPPRHQVHRWIPLVLWVLGSALVVSHFGVYLRFLVSEPALTRYAQRVQAGNSPSEPAWCLFQIAKVERLPDGSIRLTTSHGLEERGGFVYTPTTEPPDVDENPVWNSYISFGRHWWLWRNDS